MIDQCFFWGGGYLISSGGWRMNNIIITDFLLIYLFMLKRFFWHLKNEKMKKKLEDLYWTCLISGGGQAKSNQWHGCAVGAWVLDVQRPSEQWVGQAVVKPHWDCRDHMHSIQVLRTVAIYEPLQAGGSQSMWAVQQLVSVSRELKVRPRLKGHSGTHGWGRLHCKSLHWGCLPCPATGTAGEPLLSTMSCMPLTEKT